MIVTKLVTLASTHKDAEMTKSSMRTDRVNTWRGEPGDAIEFASGLEVSVFARAQLPTRHGQFEIVAFHNNHDAKDHVAFVKGDVVRGEGVRLRVHSECLTGDVFGSIKCDCRAQLDRAIDELANHESGVILYMRQEGRGIGLANKIKAYSLQDQGLDTVEANLHLGFDDDLREYDVAAAMVHLLGIESIELMTNNPKKVLGLKRHGVNVRDRRAIRTAPTDYNVDYLRTKQAKSGHLLDF